MKVINFAEHNTVINNYIAELRDVSIQKNRAWFRQNLRRIGHAMAFEVSKTLTYSEKTVETPLAPARVNTTDDRIVIGTVLRAGLALHEGFLDVFSDADSAFVSAYRKEGRKENIEICVEYIASPDLNGCTFMLVDPMLATGGSFNLAYQAYLQHWQQQHNLQTASSEAELNNPQILFQEDWLAAQNSLRVGRNEPVVEQATVWLGGTQPTVTPNQDVAEQIEAAAEAAAQSEYDAQAEHGTAELAAAAEKVVLLNAYTLPSNLQHKILCLSEQVLLERLTEKLRPHLADAVSGMVKTALQRQTALMVQNMQQAFLDEVPRLVDDVLAYNLARALAAVKKEQL